MSELEKENLNTMKKCGSVRSEIFTTAMLFIIIIVMICVIAYYFISSPEERECKRTCRTVCDDTCEKLFRGPNKGIDMGLNFGEHFPQTLESNHHDITDPQQKEGFVRPRSWAGAMRNRAVSGENMVDPRAIRESLRSVAEASDCKLFSNYCDSSNKSSNGSKEYVQKLANSRYKRGILRQQMKGNDGRPYRDQKTVSGTSTANARVNYSGLGALGTVSEPVTKKGTEMFKNLDCAIIDDRGYAKPEAFLPTTSNQALTTTSRLGGANMSLNALAGTTWKKFKDVKSPITPTRVEMEIMEGHSQPFSYEYNPNF